MLLNALVGNVALYRLFNGWQAFQLHVLALKMKITDEYVYVPLVLSLFPKCQNHVLHVYA